MLDKAFYQFFNKKSSFFGFFSQKILLTARQKNALFSRFKALLSKKFFKLILSIYI